MYPKPGQIFRSPGEIYKGKQIKRPTPGDSDLYVWIRAARNVHLISTLLSNSIA